MSGAKRRVLPANEIIRRRRAQNGKSRRTWAGLMKRPGTGGLGKWEERKALERTVPDDSLGGMEGGENRSATGLGRQAKGQAPSVARQRQAAFLCLWSVSP
jgi:hypothetical protein